MKENIKDRIKTIQDEVGEIIDLAEDTEILGIAGKILHDTILLWRELKNEN